MGRGSDERVDRHRDKSSLALGLAVSGPFDQGRPVRSHSDGEPPYGRHRMSCSQ